MQRLIRNRPHFAKPSTQGATASAKAPAQPRGAPFEPQGLIGTKVKRDGKPKPKHGAQGKGKSTFSSANSQLGHGNPGWVKQPKVPQPAGTSGSPLTTPPPHQDARGHLNRKREREASGSTTTLAPGPQEQEHRAPPRESRESQKGDWSNTPKKKVQLEPPSQAAPQSRRGRQGLVTSCQPGTQGPCQGHLRVLETPGGRRQASPLPLPRGTRPAGTVGSAR